MKRIFVVTKYEFIFSNIKDYLTQHLDVEVIFITDLSFIDNYLDEIHDLILIFKDDLITYYDKLKLIKANIIVLTNIKMKNLNNNIRVMNYPVHLNDLLNTIKNIDINSFSSVDEYFIPGYVLKLVYEETTLKDILREKFINMTATEGKILKKLFLNYPAAVSKSSIGVFENTKIETNSIETHIFNIRKKLIQNHFQFEIIKENDNYKLLIKR